MLLKLVIISLLQNVVLCLEKTGKDGKPLVKPYVFPIPLELPDRNSRAEQCWLRVEDVEIIETVTVYCFIAHGFLTNYIHDYNARKMTEDGVNVSLWIEKPRRHEENIVPPENNPHEVEDWRSTTVLDPTTSMRLYVSKNADCKLLLYSREGVSNYDVNCQRILYYVNVRMSGASSVFTPKQNLFVLFTSVSIVIMQLM